MCHHAHIHVSLSADEKKRVRKVAGLMVPIYASLLLAVLAVAMLAGALDQGELVAARPASVATR